MASEIPASSAPDPFLAVFLCLPPVLLALRFFWKMPPWWAIVLLISLGGWAAWFLAATSHFEDLQVNVSRMDNPDPDLLDKAYSDGGPLTFALILGWLISLVYALPWWILYLLAAGLRRWVRKSRATPE